MVRSTEHIDAVLENLREAWTRNPELRLGQPLVIAVKPKTACTEIFHAEDEQLVKGLGEMSKIATGKESAG